MLVRRTQSLDKDPRDFALAKKMEKFMPSFTNVEAKLVKSMILNKTYPFVRLSPSILEFERRSKAFKWSILLFIVSVSWFVIVKILTRYKVAFLSYIGEVQEIMLMLGECRMLDLILICNLQFIMDTENDTGTLILALESLQCYVLLPIDFLHTTS